MPATTPPTIETITLDKLVPFRNHPFISYEGIESVLTEALRAYFGR
jgi:hypothetical protein